MLSIHIPQPHAVEAFFILPCSLMGTSGSISEKVIIREPDL